MGKMSSKGVASEKNQGTFMTRDGERCILKGFGLMKIEINDKTSAVSLWRMLTNSEKLSWINDLIAVVTFESDDMMWTDFNIIIHE